MLRSSNVTSYIFTIVCGSLLIYGKGISESCFSNASGIIIDSTFYTLPLFNKRNAGDVQEFCRLAGSTVTNLRSAENKKPRILQPYFYKSILKKENDTLLKINVYQNTEKKTWLRYFLSAESIGESPDIYLSSLEPYLDGYEVYKAVPYITLYRRLIRSLSAYVGIIFCTRRNLDGRLPDLITKQNCPTQTKRAFESYIASVDTSRTHLEHFRTPDLSSFVQLPGQPITPGFFLDGNEPILKIPDIGIFTGIRSDYNQSKWYWNGESEASELGLQDSDPLLCEEMSWQLGVFYEFKLSPVDCSNKNNRFSCEYPITFQLSQLSCFSTSLRLSWKFEGIRQFKSNIEFTAGVFLESGHSLRNDTFHLNQSEFIIGQLREDSIYSVQIFSNICFENRITTLTNRTSRGVPGTILNARVLEHEYGRNNCLIAWHHDYFRDRGILVYKIIATNNIRSRQEILVSTSTNPSLEDRVNQQHSYRVNLNEDFHNTSVSFTIQGITCEFKGQLTFVNGSCFFFDDAQTRLHNSPGKLVSIFVLIGVIFAIAFLVALAYKTKKRKQATKTWIESKEKAESNRPSIRYTKNSYDQSVNSIDDNKDESQQDSVGN